MAHCILLLDGPFVLCFSPLVGSLVASLLVRLVWVRASEYVLSLDFGTRDYNIWSCVLMKYHIVTSRQPQPPLSNNNLKEEHVTVEQKTFEEPKMSCLVGPAVGSTRLRPT